MSNGRSLAVDKERIESELAEAQKKTGKANALAKLTPYEREILGL